MWAPLLETVKSWETDWPMQYVLQSDWGGKKAEYLLRRGESVEVIVHQVKWKFRSDAFGSLSRWPPSLSLNPKPARPHPLQESAKLQERRQLWEHQQCGDQLWTKIATSNFAEELATKVLRTTRFLKQAWSTLAQLRISVCPELLPPALRVPGFSNDHTSTSIAWKQASNPQEKTTQPAPGLLMVSRLVTQSLVALEIY